MDSFQTLLDTNTVFFPFASFLAGGLINSDAGSETIRAEKFCCETSNPAMSFHTRVSLPQDTLPGGSFGS